MLRKTKPNNSSSPPPSVRLQTRWRKVPNRKKNIAFITLNTVKLQQKWSQEFLSAQEQSFGVAKKTLSGLEK
jgi:hypothetical protein